MLLAFQKIKHHIERTFQQESLSQRGSFAVEIPSTSTKKKHTGVMSRLSHLCQEKDEILQHILSFKQCKVMMPQFSEEEYFIIVFSGVLKKIYCFLLFSGFYASFFERQTL